MLWELKWRWGVRKALALNPDRRSEKAWGQWQTLTGLKFRLCQSAWLVQGHTGPGLPVYRAQCLSSSLTTKSRAVAAVSRAHKSPGTSGYTTPPRLFPTVLESGANRMKGVHFIKYLETHCLSGNCIKGMCVFVCLTWKLKQNDPVLKIMN